MPEGPLLNGSADSSFADAPSKKSTLGQVYWFLGALIDWKSKTSTRVLNSSTDAECCSLVMFGKENSWLRDLLKELGIFMVNKPTPVQEDNTAAIALSGQGPTKRSRHYNISFYKFKEQVELNEMAFETSTRMKTQLIFSPSRLPEPSSNIFVTSSWAEIFSSAKEHDPDTVD